MESNNPNQNIEIKAKDDVLEGKYANIANLAHTKEEFILDFMSVFPPQGVLASRVIVSPAHFKRMIKAMQDSLYKYESQFGKIEDSGETKQQFVWPVK